MRHATFAGAAFSKHRPKHVPPFVKGDSFGSNEWNNKRLLKFVCFRDKQFH